MSAIELRPAEAAKLGRALDAADAALDQRLHAWEGWKETLANLPYEEALAAISKSIVDGMRPPEGAEIPRGNDPAKDAA